MKIRDAAQQTKTESVWHNGEQAHLKVFCHKTPCSHFHGCVKECCVAPPWMKASKRNVSLFNQEASIGIFGFGFF